MSVAGGKAPASPAYSWLAPTLFLGAMSGLVYGLLHLPPLPPPAPYQCPRMVPGGWELVSFKVAQDGHEYDCRFVKRALPAVKPGVR